LDFYTFVAKKLLPFDPDFGYTSVYEDELKLNRTHTRTMTFQIIHQHHNWLTGQIHTAEVNKGDV